MHYLRSLLATMERWLIPVSRPIDRVLQALQILAVTQFLLSISLHLLTIAVGTPTVIHASYALAAVTCPICIIVAGAIEIAARCVHGPTREHWKILDAQNPGLSARAKLGRHIHKVVGIKIKSFIPARVRTFYFLSVLYFILSTIPWLLYANSSVATLSPADSAQQSKQSVGRKPHFEIQVANWGPLVTNVSALSALAMLVAITYVYPSLSKAPPRSPEDAKKPVG